MKSYKACSRSARSQKYGSDDNLGLLFEYCDKATADGDLQVTRFEAALSISLLGTPPRLENEMIHCDDVALCEPEEWEAKSQQFVARLSDYRRVGMLPVWLAEAMDEFRLERGGRQDDKASEDRVSGSVCAAAEHPRDSAPRTGTGGFSS